MESSVLSAFQSFKPEDGCAWVKWDFSFPIFQHFAIFGPKDFYSDEDPSLVYEYPPNGNASEYGIARFIFFDPILETQAKVSFFDSHFPNTPETLNFQSEELLLLKSQADSPTFIYCLRFQATPPLRPATEDFETLKQNCYKAHVEWEKTKKLPLCRFAICFITSHPFYNFYFSILRHIMALEARSRTSAINLFDPSQKSNVRSTSWPEASFDTRTLFLDQLYNMNLPIYGEYFSILFGNKTFTWKMPHTQDVPQFLAQWGLSSIFPWVQLDDLLSIISALLLEKYFIVIGRSIQEIMKAVSFLPQLIHPFTWMNPIITIIPPDLFDLLDSPMANILGIRIPDDHDEEEKL